MMPKTEGWGKHLLRVEEADGLREGRGEPAIGGAKGSGWITKQSTAGQSATRSGARCHSDARRSKEG